MRPRRSIANAVLAAVLLALPACGAVGDEQGFEDEGESVARPDAQPATSTDDDFGSVAAPCGPGDATVKADEAGLGTDRLYLGVGNDRTSQIRPGLLAELWDASVGFAEWCNARGGIGGLRIELVDLDSELLAVESVMATACTDVFAMVGGGMVQDNLQFSGKDGSDFHRCGLVDLPAFAVSVEKTEGNGQVQAVPNPAYSIPTTWTKDYRTLHPDARRVALVYGDLPSLRNVALQEQDAIRAAGLELAGEVKYGPLDSDFLPAAQQVIDTGADTLMYVGEPENLALLARDLRDQNWSGRILVETNLYDPKLFSSGPGAVDGILVRSYFHPLEEADRWPAVAKYIEVARKANGNAKIAVLGQQSISSWLLFATAANRCIERDGGELSRACILEEAAAEDEWTGGGLHAPTDPGGSRAAPCGLLLEARDGAFVRRYPEIGGQGDDRDGFHCPSDGTTNVTADLGEGRVDPGRPPIGD